MSLWEHRDFMKLWAGQAVSEVGSRITREGLPMAAVLVMSVSPLGMSGLSLASQLPASLAGLFIGLWVDRLNRRPLMIGADLLRALLILLVPAAAIAGVLKLWMLFVLGGVLGLLTMLFEVSWQSYIPWLIDRKQLVEGNSKLGMSESFAEVIGPGITGILVQILTAPIAMIFDAASYVFSAIMLWRIQSVEPGRREGPGETLAGPRTVDGGSDVTGAVENGDEFTLANAHDGSPLVQGWRQELAEGLQAIRRNPIILALVGASATAGFSSSAIFVLDTLYAFKTLGLSPGIFGLTVTMGGVGALFGAAISQAFIRKVGVGRALIISLLVRGLTASLWVFAGGPIWRSVLLLFAWQLLGDASGMIFGILNNTLRQTVTSDRVLGRVNATNQVVNVGLTAIGALLAGILGEAIGIRATLAISAAGMILSTGWVLLPATRHLRTMPEGPGAATGGTVDA